MTSLRVFRLFFPFLVLSSGVIKVFVLSVAWKHRSFHAGLIESRRTMQGAHTQLWDKDPKLRSYQPLVRQRANLRSQNSFYPQMCLWLFFPSCVFFFSSPFFCWLFLTKFFFPSPIPPGDCVCVSIWTPNSATLRLVPKKWPDKEISSHDDCSSVKVLSVQNALVRHLKG